jgi:hypothetical protein
VSEDRFDQVEREHEERRRAAADMSHVLGLDVAEGDTSATASLAEAKPAEEPGEAGKAGSADAGDRTPGEPPRAPTVAEQFRDWLLYDEAGWPRR